MGNTFKNIASMVAAVLLITACQKDSTGGKLSYVFKPANLAASIGSTASASGLAVAPNSNGSMTWTSGTLNIREIVFSAKLGQVNSEVKYEKLTNIDVLNTGVVSGDINLTDGTYNDIKIKLNLAQSAVNIPLVLKGTYTEISGTKIPVEVQFNEDAELKLSPPAVVINGNKYTANVTLDFAKMVQGLVAADLGQTTRTQPNNTILVSSSLNPALYAKLKANLLLVPSVSIVAGP